MFAFYGINAKSPTIHHGRWGLLYNYELKRVFIYLSNICPNIGLFLDYFSSV